MMKWFSYVGDLDDPNFSWDNPSTLPRPIMSLGMRADYNLGISVFFVIDAIQQKRYDGKLLDWRAWGLKLSGGQICAMLPDLERFAVALDHWRNYVLVIADIDILQLRHSKIQSSNAVYCIGRGVVPSPESTKS